MMMEMKAPATAGAVCALVSGFGGHRIRFAPDDGLGAAPPDTGAVAAPTASEPVSIRDSLSAALKAQEAPPPATDAAQGSSEQDAATTTAEAEQAAQRARDEKGRFAAKDGQDAAQPAEAKPEGEQATDPKPDAPKVIQAPASLNAQEKEAFAKAPPDLQQFIVRREYQRDADYQRKTQEIAAERKLYGELQQPMTAVAQFAQRFNAHPGQVLERWAAVQDGLLRDPAGTIKTLAQQFNVPLAQLAGDGQQQDTYVDPQVAALQQKVATFEQHFQSQQQQAELAKRQQDLAARQTVESSITEFSSATDDVGQPKYPHFEALRPHMAALIETGAAKDLSDAYDQAMWSRPDLREQLLAAQREQAQRQVRETQAQQAAKAKSAAVSVAGAPGGIVPPPGPSDTSIRALLERGLAGSRT